MSLFPRSQQFAAATQAWLRSRVAAQNKAMNAGTLRVSRSLEGKREQWLVRAGRYLRTRPDIARRYNGWDISVDPDLQEAVQELMEAVAPKLSAAYDKHLAGLAFDAFKKWPVYTGLSKSLLRLDYEQLSDGRFVGRLSSNAPYTFFIDSQPHRKLIDTPAATVARDIANAALEEIARG